MAPEQPLVDRLSSRSAPLITAGDATPAMSLEAKVGQMLMAGFPGSGAGPEIAHLINERHIGGAILFARNCQSPAQVRELTQTLQALSRLPLFVAVDQEGGIVARLQHPVTVFPSNMAIGATGSAAYAEMAARCTAGALASLGINVNFAPCLDVNSNPRNPVIGVRSYGGDPSLVAELGAAAVRGCQRQGILATAKHFPGHGDTAIDSHLALPVAAAGMERVESVELPPFRAAIDAGVGMVMTAHVMFPASGATRPSTLAPEILTDLLRNRLRFGGLICTDCMEMEAIASTYGVAEAAVLAVEAGADIVLVSHRLDRQLAALDSLLAAARSGRLSAARIDESVKRILSAKRRIANAAPPPLSFPVAEHEQSALTIARAATTLLKNQGGLLPLRPGIERVALIEFTLSRPAGVENDRPLGPLAGLLRRRLPSLADLSLPGTPTDEQVSRALALAGRAGVLIVGTRNAAANPAQAAAVQALLATGRPVIVVALRAPYDLALFPAAAAQLATYGDPPCSLLAAVEVIFGEVEAGGRLPVSMGLSLVSAA